MGLGADMSVVQAGRLDGKVTCAVAACQDARLTMIRNPV